MSHFRRSYVPGGSFFFTVVTEQRTPILCTDTSRVFLRTAIRECRQEWPFRIDAMVFLENHLHVILSQPEGGTHYSARWAETLRTIEVEQPVTQLPPHRSLRAELPHKALQKLLALHTAFLLIPRKHEVCVVWQVQNS